MHSAFAMWMYRFLGSVRMLFWCMLCIPAWAWGAAPVLAKTVVVATVNNGHILQMQSLTGEFERANPGVKVRWVTLPEADLRRAVGGSVVTKTGQFDVVTVGMYEVPIWARRGWLTPLSIAADEAKDMLDNIREGLSYRGVLYGAPFYGESSMLYYRKDLFAQARIAMPARPTWADVARFAERLNDPDRKVHGICLRAKPGWGENMTLLTTIANTFGGQWFDMRWQPQLQSAPWREAVTLYVDLLRRFGPPDAVDRGYNENLSLFLKGRCAIWIDATVAAAFLHDPEQNLLAGAVGVAPAPTAVTPKGAHWLWAWALAIPSDIGPEQAEAAQRFVAWATSRAYVQRVAELRGWGMVPSGTRASLYGERKFRNAAPWSELELGAIQAANPRDATLLPSPYLGVQFAVIPEFAMIGDDVGGHVAQAVMGRLSVDEALARSQRAAQRRMRTASPP